VSGNTCCNVCAGMEAKALERPSAIKMALSMSTALAKMSNQVGSSDLIWIPADEHGPKPGSDFNTVIIQTKGFDDAGLAVTRKNACKSLAAMGECQRANCHFFHFNPGTVVDNFAGLQPKFMRYVHPRVKFDSLHGPLFRWSEKDIKKFQKMQDQDVNPTPLKKRKRKKEDDIEEVN
jgi:hypothetical protein